MATWVRQGTGTAPSSTDANLTGRYSLDNGTAPGDFDPAGVTSVQIAYTITGSGTWIDDDWDDLRAASLDDGTNVGASINGTDNTGLTSGTSNTDETDNTPNTGLTEAQWEAMAVSGGTGVNGSYTTHNQTMKGDGGVQTMSALTVTITYTPATAHNVDQAAFRGRQVNADGAAINAAYDASDPAENANFTQDMDTVLGLRWEIKETAGGSFSGLFKLQYRYNSGGGYGAWTDVPVAGEPWPYLNDVALGRVVIIQPSGFTDGAATTDLLTTNTGTFVTGEGMHDNASASISLNNQHTELVWRMVIPRWFDSGSNADGDLFQFRVVETDGTALDSYTNTPTVTVNVPVGHIGGIFIEQPAHIGPFADTNGNLYVFTEQTTQTNDLMVHKSSDGGDTWDQVDGANRPTTMNDPEGTDAFWDPVTTGQLLIATRSGNEDVYHHIFRTSDHATNADTWGTVDQVVDNTAGADILDSDSVSIVARDQASPTNNLYKFIFFTAGDGTNDRIYWRYHNGTSWSAVQTLDTTGSTNFSAVSAVYEANNDIIRIIYQDRTNDDMYMRTIPSDSVTPSGRTLIANNLEVASTLSRDRANLVPAVTYDDGGVDVTMYAYTRVSTNRLSTEAIRDGTQQGEVTSVNDNDHDSSGGSSHQPIATLAADGTTVHLLYSMNANNDIFHDENPDEAGWGTDTEIQDAVTCHYIRAQVFTHSAGNGGATVLGYVWDGGDGFMFRLRYDELELAAGAAGAFPPFRRRQSATVRM